MRPTLDPAIYGFACLPPGCALPRGVTPLCVFTEAEGTTIIAEQAMLAAAGVAHRGGWARITLMVHSALDAVELTAAIATALAEAGISANVVAAYYHDHVFVPWEKRASAIAVLDALARA